MNRKVGSVSIVVLLLMGVVAQAQQPTPVFKSKSDLVIVPTIVTDHSGTHILGLQQSDFRVRENGVEQKVVVFQEIKTTEQPVQRVALGPNKFSNYVTGEIAPRRITIIALDFINTPFADQAYARTQLMKFLEKASDIGEPMTLIAITRSGVKIIHDFTTDPRVLSAAVRRLKMAQQQVAEETTGEAGPEETQIAAEMNDLVQLEAEGERDMRAFQQQMAATLTIQAFQQIAQAYAGIPGRKSLIWASAGFPFSITDNDMGLATKNSLSDVLPLYERTWELLNNAPMAVYPVDLRGLLTLAPGADIRKPSVNYYRQVNTANIERIATFQRVADATGGRAFYNTNDIAGAFRKASDDSSTYYVLGYYRNSVDMKDGWRKLNVAVSRPGVQVRHRAGFFVQKSANVSADAVKQRELATALIAPLDYTSIPFTAAVQVPPAASAAKTMVRFQLVLAANAVFVDAADNNHFKLDVVALAKTRDGLTARRVGQAIEGYLTPDKLQDERQHGTTYNYQMELPRGQYTLRFVVRDELDGRIGTVTAPVQVE